MRSKYLLIPTKTRYSLVVLRFKMCLCDAIATLKRWRRTVERSQRSPLASPGDFLNNVCYLELRLFLSVAKVTGRRVHWPWVAMHLFVNVEIDLQVRFECNTCLLTLIYPLSFTVFVHTFDASYFADVIKYL